MKIGASLLFSKEECLYLRQNCGLPSTRVRSNMKRHIICDPCQIFRPFWILFTSDRVHLLQIHLQLSISLNISQYLSCRFIECCMYIFHVCFCSEVTPQDLRSPAGPAAWSVWNVPRHRLDDSSPVGDPRRKGHGKMYVCIYIYIYRNSYVFFTITKRFYQHCFFLESFFFGCDYSQTRKIQRCIYLSALGLGISPNDKKYHYPGNPTEKRNR